MIELITQIIKFLQTNEEMEDIRRDRALLRLEKKKLRIARRMYRQIRREFRKEGLTDEEKEKLKELKSAILKRKMDLILF